MRLKAAQRRSDGAERRSGCEMRSMGDWHRPVRAHLHDGPRLLPGGVGGE